MGFKDRQETFFDGGCSQVVKAVDCDSTSRGFNPRHSPFYSDKKVDSLLLDVFTFPKNLWFWGQNAANRS